MAVTSGKLVFPGADRVEMILEGGMMPKKASDGSAGFDLFCPKDTPIKYGRQIIDLGFKMLMPPFYEAQIRPRSGNSAFGFKCMAVKDGVESEVRIEADVKLGTIDSDYNSKHVGVILKVDYVQTVKFDKLYIKKGQSIAQMVFSFLPSVKMVSVDKFDESNDRGGGYGHSDK